MTRRPAPLNPQLLELSRALKRMASAGSGVVTSAQVHELGADRNDIRRLLKQPDWARAERGVYIDLSSPTRLDADHHRQCAAALATLAPGVRTGAVVSHLSAVRLLGLPLPPTFDPRASLTRQPPAPANALRNARVHVAAYDQNDVVDVAGVPVLAGPRLVVDCSQILIGDSVLAIADAMLRRGLATLPQLSSFLDRHPRMRGSPRARIVLDRADGKAENWFESASRWWFLEGGLPRPQLQVPLTDHYGNVKARVDMFFEDQWTVGEADGRGKYGAPEALVDEKEREDWIRREHRLEVVRWTYPELRTPISRSRLIDRLRAGFAHAARQRRSR